MANYTAADVKRLRELTGAGMMDCKKALEENDGDFDAAVEFLRIKGAKDVGKRAERATAEGLVAASGNALIELNAETDFVAKNDEFQELAGRVVEIARAGSINDVEELKKADLDGETVQDAIEGLSAKIGEKLQLGRVACFEGTTTSYLHRRGSGLPPAVGVLVEYTGDDTEAARGAALQIAAMKPRFLTREDVPAETVENEKHIAEQSAREEGKPEQAMPKIIDGKVNAFYKDTVLLEQASVTDSKQTAGDLLAAAGVTIKRFVRFEVGQE